MSKNKKGNEKKSFQINVWIAPVTEQWKQAITGTEGEVGAPPTRAQLRVQFEKPHRSSAGSFIRRFEQDCAVNCSEW